MAKRYDVLETPTAKHATGKRTAYGTNGHAAHILPSGLNIRWATEEYIESWRRDAEKIEAEKKQKERKA